MNPNDELKRFVLLINWLCLCLLSLLSACGDKKSQDERWWTFEDQQLVITELDRTTAALKSEVDGLGSAQWAFREAPDRWSIEEIVEHLEMQNQLHYRELTVTAAAPQYTRYRSITNGQDGYFTAYATDATPGQANWFLEPLGRFRGKQAWEAFARARGHLRSWVANTETDLRKQFTFRGTGVEGKALSEITIGEVRDLHQLLLTGIAHTDRHLAQIRKIKSHKGYPR